ncbi:hypothetical protein HL033_00160 [Neoehrlichia mikurensis]|uniref:TRP75-related protein n=1 Tax=Neoehrlichia mikurensis TaxID=89586 RepID=A0A9Q9F3D7_9RICK|nr:TRP75-related protein [Neoehrlichia mikurensis]QXK91995.1 hypothetical protein IAH97_00160 [Neoehrlichia mikurensis]QXK92452.1 hypothetical protein HUN61_00160 [Neoehrlichia mikurensis]QXK93688.1 hypothetical protein HL033_00160 [Neoehrlichia mikurensis]UTO55340.1 TRP75-related protein [Neoehrlichia mikurensis]
MFKYNTLLIIVMILVSSCFRSSVLHFSKKYTPIYNPGGEYFYSDKDFYNAYNLYKKRREMFLQKDVNKNLDSNKSNKNEFSNIAIMDKLEEYGSTDLKDAMINRDGIDLSKLDGAKFIEIDNHGSKVEGDKSHFHSVRLKDNKTVRISNVKQKNNSEKKDNVKKFNTIANSSDKNKKLNNITKQQIVKEPKVIDQQNKFNKKHKSIKLNDYSDNEIVNSQVQKHTKVVKKLDKIKDNDNQEHIKGLNKVKKGNDQQSGRMISNSDKVQAKDDQQYKQQYKKGLSKSQKGNDQQSGRMISNSDKVQAKDDRQYKQQYKKELSKSQKGNDQQSGRMISNSDKVQAKDDQQYKQQYKKELSRSQKGNDQQLSKREFNKIHNNNQSKKLLSNDNVSDFVEFEHYLSGKELKDNFNYAIRKKESDKRHDDNHSSKSTVDKGQKSLSSDALQVVDNLKNHKQQYKKDKKSQGKAHSNLSNKQKLDNSNALLNKKNDKGDAISNHSSDDGNHKLPYEKDSDNNQKLQDAPNDKSDISEYDDNDLKFFDLEENSNNDYVIQYD